ncbi:hypothetical protein M8A51_22625 [Schlegelella sp. S2-27]|uniref:Uncharacterized protein n=1 Tax=Caldimonas mangrovi TaxID=2944811 RepID=A0ABT0YUP7_9BURK|nr:hypothetical protein [Caldimonas mangrovi]MCM5682333.1 hypothetical protein [Caldimonas mangrovi]
MMDDVLEMLLRPIAKLLLALLRGLLWLGWELMFETIGWTVGWLLCRLLSAGRWPRQRWSQQDEAPGGVALVVELIGLGALALAVAALSGGWAV